MYVCLLSYACCDDILYTWQVRNDFNKDVYIYIYIESVSMPTRHIELHQNTHKKITDNFQWLKSAQLKLSSATSMDEIAHIFNEPLTRYIKLRVAHARSDMHQGTCVKHMLWCMLGSLTSGFLWSRWREKRSRPSRRMRKTQFYVYGKRPIRHSPKLNQFKSQSSMTLRWRHNDHAGVSNHQPHGCLLNRLFRRKSKKASKLRVTGLCAGNSPGTGEFPAQMASYAENNSIWWRHHELNAPVGTFWS